MRGRKGEGRYLLGSTTRDPFGVNDDFLGGDLGIGGIGDFEGDKLMVRVDDGRGEYPPGIESRLLKELG